jgi:hypothetical protein
MAFKREEMKHYLLFLWLASIVVSGCATLPMTPEKPILKEKVFERPYEEVWLALTNSLANNRDVMVHVQNKKAGVVHYIQHLPIGKKLHPYLVKNASALADYYGLSKANMMVVVKSVEENRTKVKLNCRIEGTNMGLDNMFLGLKGEKDYTDNALPSSGKLEEEFFNDLSVRIRDGSNFS